MGRLSSNTENRDIVEVELPFSKAFSQQSYRCTGKVCTDGQTGSQCKTKRQTDRQKEAANVNQSETDGQMDSSHGRALQVSVDRGIILRLILNILQHVRQHPQLRLSPTLSLSFPPSLPPSPPQLWSFGKESKGARPKTDSNCDSASAVSQ